MYHGLQQPADSGFRAGTWRHLEVLRGMHQRQACQRAVWVRENVVYFMQKAPASHIREANSTFCIL